MLPYTKYRITPGIKGNKVSFKIKKTLRLFRGKSWHPGSPRMNRYTDVSVPL